MALNSAVLSIQVTLSLLLDIYINIHQLLESGVQVSWRHQLSSHKSFAIQSLAVHKDLILPNIERTSLICNFTLPFPLYFSRSTSSSLFIMVPLHIPFFVLEDGTRSFNNGSCIPAIAVPTSVQKSNLFCDENQFCMLQLPRHYHDQEMNAGSCSIQIPTRLWCNEVVCL